MAWDDKGRSGYGDQTIIGNYDDWCGLSMNGRQWKNELTRETRQLAGSSYWNQRKALSPNHPAENIRWDSYKCPSYYHQPRQAKAVPIVEDVVEEEVPSAASVNIPTQEKKESIFLTLKKDNFFRKIYEKFVK